MTNKLSTCHVLKVKCVNAKPRFVKWSLRHRSNLELQSLRSPLFSYGCKSMPFVVEKMLRKFKKYFCQLEFQLN